MTAQPAPDTRPRWTASIDRLGPADARSVGGKAANLGELSRAGFPVPPAFAIPAQAYLEAVDAAGIRAELVERNAAARSKNDAVLARESRELQDLVRGVALPDDLRAQICGAYADLGSDVPVAVRSSAPAGGSGSRPPPTSRRPGRTGTNAGRAWKSSRNWPRRTTTGSSGGARPTRRAATRPPSAPG